MSLWTRIRCLIGFHDFHSDLNAKYEFCIHCRKRVRVI